MLEAVAGASSTSEVATATGFPLYRVRSGLRELVAAGLVKEAGERFTRTELGTKKLKPAS
jgi:DNA-binding IclR family transcriptional regulator